MKKHFQALGIAALGAGIWLACGSIAWSTLTPAQVSERARPAFATSVAFELRSQVEQASFNLRRASLRAIYEAIADAYGIRLLYDRDLGEPDLVSDFRLQDVTLREALDAAENISKTFVAPVDERTGVIASDTPQKRGEFERQILRTFYLDDQTTPEQLSEITTALRTLLDLRRVAQDTRSNLISARGRVRQMIAAGEFVQTFAKQQGEVMLEVEIFEFNHLRARELGILPPQPFRLIFLGEDASASSETLLTFGQGRSFYGVGLPGAEARMSFSSSVVRSLRKLQLRASHGQEAKLLVGERFPVISASLTSSFVLTGDTSQQPSTAGLGFFPSIQYENLGVTITATPYLHAGRELTLKLDLALRTLGGRTLNGVPVIANRQLTGQFRLRDGESYLIGGILDRSERKSRSGFPLLSRIPWVGRLFGAHSSQERVTELLILIRPRILRPAIAEQYASRAIFFGKELTGLPAAPAPPAPPTPTPGQPATPGAPGAVQPGVPTPGQLQPGQVQPGTFQPGIPQPGNRPQTVPQGVVPGNLFPQGVVPPGFPQPTQPRPNQP
ncbi:MAG: hypothetical protein IH846_12875 [Acidobacteria bacterium]|nr:hypothetical protein [Acidobacteriota bacterium]